MRMILDGAGQVDRIILILCNANHEDVRAIRAKVLRGEKTEVGGIFGAVIRAGKRSGVATPLRRATLKVCLSIESCQQVIDMQNYAELCAVQ
ncbi:MAG TPA: ketopantoate reductase C-terminal domain-containing protein [Candidatus Binatus sp.]|nr:ketopantoate reductase C-terminal domain-containing protein [Candidatus Binatus sp.]